jgi:hypothetical protein
MLLAASAILAVEVSAFDLVIDRVEIDGNVFGPADGTPDLVDDFTDGVLGPSFTTYTATSFESGGFFHAASPGGVVTFNGTPFELSNGATVQEVADGAGSFTADAYLPAVAPPLGESVSLTVWNPTTTDIFSAVLTNWNGLDFVQSIGSGLPPPAYATVDQRTPFDPDSATGAIVLRVVYDDGAKTLQAAFSIDGGGSFSAPFAAAPLPTPLDGPLLLSGLVTPPGPPPTTSTSTTSTSTTTSTTVPFASTCPENVCVCLGEARRWAVVALERARIHQGPAETNALVDGDTCATSIRTSGAVLPSPTTTGSLFALRGAPRKAIGVGGVTLVDGDVVTGGGGLFVHRLAEITGVVDLSGSHPGLGPCGQAHLDALAASAALAALAPTRNLGAVAGVAELTADPGVNVWAATTIDLQDEELDIVLRPDTDALVINAPTVRLRSATIRVDGAAGGDPARVVLNVPGRGPRITATLSTLDPMLLAPERRVRMGAFASTVVGRSVDAAGRHVRTVCP